MRLWRPSIKYGLAAWLLLRVLASAGAALSLRFLETGPTAAVPGFGPPRLGPWGEVLAGVWLRSDALWYLKIAESGYDHPGTFAFFPFFPLVVRALAPLFGNVLFAGLVAASACTLGGLILLYVWAEKLLGGRTARSAVFATALFPTSFFFVAPYGEAAFLLAASAALAAAAYKKGWAAGTAGFFAALTRPFGVLVAVPLLFALKGKARLAALGPIIGLATWTTFVALRTGDVLYAMKVQSIWQREPAFFPATIVRGIKAVWDYRQTEYLWYMSMDLAALVAGTLLTALAFYTFRRASRRAEAAGLGLYGALSLLLPLSSVFAPRPLMSFPRFVLSLFPLTAAAGDYPPRAQIAAGILSGSTLVLLTALYVAAKPIF